jgi:hypothetical protein
VSDESNVIEVIGSEQAAEPTADSVADCNVHPNENCGVHPTGEATGSEAAVAFALGKGSNCDVHSTGESGCVSSATSSSGPLSEDGQDVFAEQSVNDGAAADCDVHSSRDDTDADRSHVVDFTAESARRGPKPLWDVHPNELGVDWKEHSSDPVDRAVVPTVETYGQLQFAYNFINSEFCNGKLPDCLIVVGTGSRSLGYFIEDRFVRENGERTDKIALNFNGVPGRESTAQLLSTLAHEAKHLEQKHFGTPGRGRYHNKEWAGMMADIGLIPSDTGKEGGKRTGDRVSHYIEPGGRFARAVEKLLATGFVITWREVPAKRVSTGGEDGGDAGSLSGKRSKFTCPVCGANAWGKADLDLVCGHHHKKMVPADDSSAPPPAP